ncbi:MAG TPA: alpha/beta hydrolase [Baekduia sp.]|nr:alpha/beta hydrolase [Baekduia sp.]
MPSPSLLAGRAAAAASGVSGRLLFALPPGVLRRIAGTPPPPAEELDPEAWLLAKLSRRGPELTRDEIPVPEQRRRLELTARPMGLRAPLPLRTEDVAIPGAAGSIPGRLYVPASAAAVDGPGPGPLLVYFHGGGWVQGSIASHDRSCRLLAHLAGVRVLSVDYRLAPEHRFPAAADDALTAYRWAVAEADRLGADPQRIAVGGDSAGGNLAAVTAIAVRDARRAGDPLPPVAFQLLLYPVCDISQKSASVRRFADGFYLTERNMDWFSDQYVPDRAQRSDPRVSPLLAPDLSGLPPAHVTTCATDPLRDEGEAYARRLREAGVAVAVQRHGQLHGFFNTTVIRSSRERFGQIAGALRQGLAAPASPPEPAVQS